MEIKNLQIQIAPNSSGLLCHSGGAAVHELDEVRQSASNRDLRHVGSEMVGELDEVRESASNCNLSHVGG